ncbi:MAG: tetratricopeptide repeat protein [Candidatus Omnitrophica bacterium]|nr:tetratricopeptide repeat protein [Candidatus Omnitrophota bacterium]
MNANKRFFWVIASLVLSGFIFNAAPQKVEEGNRYFEKGDYEKALDRYGKAQTARPNAPEIPFNMGNSFYREKRFDEAIQSHNRSIELGPDALKAKAHYNIGNSLYRKGDVQGALEAYKKAVDLDPSDVDTKYNIEFIQREQEASSQKSQSEQEEKPQPTQEEKKETELSKKDAERLLGALQSEEKSLPKEKEKMQRHQEEPVLKDW